MIEEEWTEYELIQSIKEMQRGVDMGAQIEYRAILEDLYFKSVMVTGEVIIPTNCTEECV